MPRTKLDVDCDLEYLGILDENGKLDEELEPALDDALATRLHHAMLRARRFDEQMLSLQRQGRLGTFAPVRGQEASQLGAVCHLRDDDWMVPSYREIAALLWRGVPPAALLVFNAGYNEGAAIDENRNDLPGAVPVGTQMLHAAGLAYGERCQGRDRVAMTFFGDGATSQGDFHEALNFAAVFESPAVFVCENNQYAISVPRSRQTKSQTLAQKGVAHGVAALQVDGNDLLAVYAACQEAVKRAREEHQPTLIECVTYRLTVHTTVDDPSKYRESEEVERWKKRDPLPRYQGYLKQRGLLDDDGIEKLEEEIAEEMKQAVSEMDARIEELGGPEVMFEHVHAEQPAYLKEQQQRMEA